MTFNEAMELVRVLRESESPADDFGAALKDASRDNNNFNELAQRYPTLPNVIGIVVSVAKKLMLDGPEEGAFYTSLWGLLSSDGLFTSDEERALALLFLQDSLLIPYRDLPLTSMSDDDYVAYRERLLSSIEALHHVMQRDFLQKTQEASAMLAILDSCDSGEEKAVLMSMLLSMVRERTVDN